MSNYIYTVNGEYNKIKNVIEMYNQNKDIILLQKVIRLYVVK